jgi:hypothetical protein
MPDTPSITINKVFPYRGVPEVYSNTYHFSGTTPTTDAAWHALALAIFGAEAPLLNSTVKFVGYLGYEAGNEHAVSIKNYLEDGTTQVPGSAAGGIASVAGDQAIWVRWVTPDRTSRGKRIYLRKYLHGVPVTGDTVPSAIATAGLAYGNKMIDGSLPGGAKICGPQGAVASNPTVSPFTTVHTLKRRGKRPSR